jgi:hypothetical protein
MIVAGMLGHSLAILKPAYIPGTLDEPLGCASLASAARMMDEIISRSSLETWDGKRAEQLPICMKSI